MSEAEIERLRMAVAEYERSHIALTKFMGILENIMQEIDDSRIKSETPEETVLLFNQWKGLNRFKKELEKIMEGEE